MVITVGESRGSSAWPLLTVAIVLSRRAAFEEPNNGVERARATVGDLASLRTRAEQPGTWVTEQTGNMGNTQRPWMM